MGKAKKKQQRKYENWEPRDGLDRPTPERRKRGHFRLSETRIAGVTVAIDDCPDNVAYLHRAGVINGRQEEAARRFEEVCRGGIGSVSTRSCIDFSPVGYEGDLEDDEETRQQAEWRELRNHMTPVLRKELEKLCRDHDPYIRIAKIKLGLDQAADFFRIPEDGG